MALLKRLLKQFIIGNIYLKRLCEFKYGIFSTVFIWFKLWIPFHLIQLFGKCVLTGVCNSTLTTSTTIISISNHKSNDYGFLSLSTNHFQIQVASHSTSVNFDFKCLLYSNPHISNVIYKWYAVNMSVSCKILIIYLI